MEMMDQEVWAVPYEHTMRYTAEELQEVLCPLSSRLAYALSSLFRSGIIMHVNAACRTCWPHYWPCGCCSCGCNSASS